MKILLTAGCLLLFGCFGFTFLAKTDYLVVPMVKVSIAQKPRPNGKTGTFLYTESKQLQEAFSFVSNDELKPFDFENNRYVHIQYAQQEGCKEAVEVIQEIRKYKHHYEIILTPFVKGECKKSIHPFQLIALPTDGLPVLITGALPE